MKKILVIEDDVLLRKIIVDKLKEENFEILEAGDGEEGLKMAIEQSPDLILLDIILPKMDGMEALRKIREDQWGSKVPVIILTNLADGEKMAEAIDSKVHDYLIKTDWELEDVIKKIKNRLKI